jgi:hypothetical protein
MGTQQIQGPTGMLEDEEFQNYRFSIESSEIANESTSTNSASPVS